MYIMPSTHPAIYYQLLSTNLGLSKGQIDFAGCRYMNTDLHHNAVGDGNGIPNVSSPEACQVKCQEVKECKFWTYAPRDTTYSERCFMKTSKKGFGFSKNLVSGPKFCRKYITVRYPDVASHMHIRYTF